VRIVRLATVLALAYSSVHFVKSGVLFPLSQAHIGQIEEELPALRSHLETGGPVLTTNPRQYGPTFFFVLHPLMRITRGDSLALSRWLYAIEILCLVAAFWLTWATLQPLIPAARRGLTLWLLLILWENFAPMYAILGVKNVEIWELALISAALYFLVRGMPLPSGLALSAAGLTKLLPFTFFYYLLLRHRRAFLVALGSLAALLLVGQVLYGSAIGFMYLPHVAKAAVGNSWALDWHENVSVKGMIAKSFGHLPRGADLDHGNPVLHQLIFTGGQLRHAVIWGQIAEAIGAIWLTWVIVRNRSPAGQERVVWEWSLFAAMLLILSPQTAFEYCTLSLGAFSYALVRILGDAWRGERRFATWLTFGAAVFLVGNIVPRPVANALVLAGPLTRRMGNPQLSPSEAFQFYGFPLLGLFLLVVTLWRLREPLTRVR
jgi:hypothetical protein